MLRLEPNHDTISHDAQVQYLDAAGNVGRTEAFDRTEYRIFKGTAWVEVDGAWVNAGWARINVRKDGDQPLFEGAFQIAHDSHHIQLSSHYMHTKHEEDPDLENADDDYMVVWRDSDVSGTRDAQSWQSFISGGHDYLLESYSAGLDRRGFVDRDMTISRNARSWGYLSTRTLFNKRQTSIDGGGTTGSSGNINLKNSIGSTTGCPTTRKVALVGVATDCTYTGQFNSTDSARQNIINQFASASAVYESTFNITLGIQNLTISEANCPSTAADATPWNVDCGSATVSQRLQLFSQWRGTRLDSNAYWTLLSHCATGAEVGLSWTGALCTRGLDANNGTGANIVVKTSSEWQVIAHESGHTFGAVHDCDRQTCADANIINSQQCCPVSQAACDAGGQFIMNPATGTGITKFSPCTVGNICSAMNVNSVNTTCLRDNVQVPLITSAMCGNGIVEAGEDCDCGGTAACAGNACCNPTTCKFQAGAVCDDANEACCARCRFKPATAVCRASTGVCDPPETCSGANGTCPADVTAPNGQACAAGLACSSGQCSSRDLQCKQLMGTSLTNGKNDTYSCDQQGCSISCASPEFGPNTCYQMQQNFLDGTSCGGNGQCSKVS